MTHTDVHSSYTYKSSYYAFYYEYSICEDSFALIYLLRCKTEMKNKSLALHPAVFLFYHFSMLQ